MKKRWAAALSALLLAAGAAAAEGRTVFVNPLAGKVYHCAKECATMDSSLWPGMMEFSAEGFAASAFAGFRKCGVCYSEIESFKSPAGFGQMGEEGLFYPIWQPEDEEPWRERRAAERTADLNHDGLPDRIEIAITPDEEGKTNEELVDGVSIAVAKVYLGKAEGGYEETARFVSRDYNGSHVGNGTLALVRRDGLDYLMDCDFYVIMGEGDYGFTVYWLEDGMGISVMDRRMVSFAAGEGGPQDGSGAPAGAEETLPAFREAMERWTAESELLISAHVDLPPVICAEGEHHPITEVTDAVFTMEW